MLSTFLFVPVVLAQSFHQYIALINDSSMSKSTSEATIASFKSEQSTFKVIKLNTTSIQAQEMLKQTGIEMIEPDYNVQIKEDMSIINSSTKSWVNLAFLEINYFNY